jgi:hypothetical protein
MFISACASPTPAPTPTLVPPSTATPLPLPTDTAQPSAATLPPATLPPTATAAPSPTLAATPAPTADPLHTACDHPYWPLRQGAVWHIDAKTRVYTETITSVTGDLTRAEATLVDTYTNGTSQMVLIECDRAGLAYGNASFTFADGHISTKTVTDYSGRFLPAVEKLAPGAKWSWNVTADYSVPNYDKSGKFTKQSEYQNVSSQACTLVKNSTLTLTVGSFSAVEIDCQGSDVSTSNGVTTTYPFNAQLAYGRGLGPNGASIKSYSIP